MFTNNELQKFDYIRVKASYAKMKTAETIDQTVYVYGVSGHGKTEMVKHFLGKNKYTSYSCEKGLLQLENSCMEERTIVIDDLQFLKNEEERKKVLEFLESDEHWIIFISRSPIPAWLKPSYLRNPFVTIDEKDLSWTTQDVEKYFAKQEIDITSEQIEEISRISKGNPMTIRTMAHTIKQSGEFTANTIKQVRTDLEDYTNQKLIGEWEAPIVNFLSYMSFLDSFSVPLAEMVTGDCDSYKLLEEAKELGNFIFNVTDETYTIKPILRTALVRRAKKVWGLERCNRIFYDVGIYYEAKGDEVLALSFFEKSGNKDRIVELLTRNARKNPGAGHYFELRKYYLALPEETIKQDAALISGMSMLYSLLLETEQSEYWYEQLKIFETKQTGALKREAKSYITYLDIALPHRGIAGVLDIIKSIPTLLFDQGISLPEFSVTSNQPSIMNGGKDFSKWSKHDKEIMTSAGKVISLVLGKYGKGLVNIALGESLYEKAGDTYEVISLLGKGSLEAEMGGKIEIEFAAVGIQVRLNLFHGNEEAAKSILKSFAKKAADNQEIQNTIEAMKCRIALYESNTEQIQEWMKTAPDETKEFNIMERY